MSAEIPQNTGEIPQNTGRQEPKVTKMPSQEDMYKRLQAIGLYGQIYEVDRFYDSLVGYLKDHEIVGAGVNMAWEFAAHDTLQKCSKVRKNMIYMSFNVVVDALVPDPEVAEDAKTIRKKIMDKLREEAEKAKRPAVENQSSNYDLYVAARKIGDIVLEQASRKAGQRGEGVWIEDWRGQGVNPYYGQTESGLFLVFSYGLPDAILTPWGKWSFRGSVITSVDQQRRLNEAVLNRLIVTMLSPQINDEEGSVGPTYLVYAIDGDKLPDPVIRSQNAYLEYEKAKEAWEKFTEQYEQEKGK